MPVRRGRPRRLLLSLLLQRGLAVPPETLVDQLWGDEPPVNAGNALQILVSYLRKALGGHPGIETTAAGYRLVVPADQVDMHRFEELVRSAGQVDVPPARRSALLTEALALWRGPALSEAADDAFAQGEISRLAELRLLAEELRAEAQLALGRHAEALPDLGRLVREHPFRERLVAQLALALYRSGRQADALAALETARTTLADELGLDLAPDLQELTQRILRQDPVLDAPAAGHDAPTPAPVALPGGDRTAAGPSERPRGAATGLPPAGAGVPASLTALVGRDNQLAAVAGLLARSRVVTLTGPGGAGKTRLGEESARRWGGPVSWADLSAVTDRPGVATVVAAATGATLTPGRDPVDALRRSIGDRGLLLVLDTCEHVVAHVDELVTALVSGCPGLRVLATSRRPLGVVGGLTWPVPPLTLPDAADADVATVGRSSAVQLFCERAAAVRPGFTLDAGNAPAVGEVCRLLDGLPLAIELAAAHAAALSPAKTAELLRDRLRLVDAADDRRGRHAGLRATVDWSYGLLSDDEARFLDRLSTFAGPFVVEAAVEVAGAGLTEDGLALLMSLVRQSLVSVVEDDHFRLLDTIRTYASARLGSRPADERATRDRHARWFRHFAEDADRSIRGADQAGWLAELRTVPADLRAALRHCFHGVPAQPALGAALVCSLSWFWSFEGAFTEARGWVAEATAAGPYEPRTSAWLHLAAGMHAESVGDLDAAERECTEAAAGFAGIADARGEARSLLHLGTVRWARGLLAEAAAAQDRSVALFRAQRHDSGAGLGLVLRARTALDAGDPAGAREFLLEARPVVRRSGDQHLEALRLEQLARVGLAEGDLDDAGALAGEGLVLFEQVGYAEGIGAALQTLGRVRLALGDPRGARVFCLRATGNAVRLGHLAGVVEGLELLAEACAAEDGAVVATRLLGRADQLRSEGGLPRSPAQERHLDPWRGRLRGTLGSRFAAVEAEGRRSSVDELLAGLGVVRTADLPTDGT
ncbi:BTAD domain-containing putative transcriptional regulator [Modestobacter versicolor]|uniref:BTAD domain-containing putative transcriptional regulator n=1 Tax=Modestobacter versicolor TaxID=429133 RepID=UPI0034DE5275